MSYWGDFIRWSDINLGGEVNLRVIMTDVEKRFMNILEHIKASHGELSYEERQKVLYAAADDCSMLFAYLILIAKNFGITEFQLEDYIYQKIGRTEERVESYSRDDANIKKYYDLAFHQGYVGNSPEHRIFANWINGLFHPASILDVGCGPGYFSHHMKTINPDVFVASMDISDIGLLGGKPTNGIVGIAWKLPFRDNSFDLINCGAVFEHVPLRHIDELLDEFERVARRKIIYIALDKTAAEPISYGIEHITIANRTWWINKIGTRTNWLIGGREDPDPSDICLDPRFPGAWSRVNWEGTELDKYFK